MQKEVVFEAGGVETVTDWKYILLSLKETAKCLIVSNVTSVGTGSMSFCVSKHFL